MDIWPPLRLIVIIIAVVAALALLLRLFRNRLPPRLAWARLAWMLSSPGAAAAQWISLMVGVVVIFFNPPQIPRPTVPPPRPERLLRYRLLDHHMVATEDPILARRDGTSRIQILVDGSRVPRLDFYDFRVTNAGSLDLKDIPIQVRLSYVVFRSTDPRNLPLDYPLRVVQGYVLFTEISEQGESQGLMFRDVAKFTDSFTCDLLKVGEAIKVYVYVARPRERPLETDVDIRVDLECRLADVIFEREPNEREKSDHGPADHASH